MRLYHFAFLAPQQGNHYKNMKIRQDRQNFFFQSHLSPDIYYFLKSTFTGSFAASSFNSNSSLFLKPFMFATILEGNT